MTAGVLGNDDPINVNTVEYDFENYALEHGIPETLDPLPYRKSGSVFANTHEGGGGGGGENQDTSGGGDAIMEEEGGGLTSAKHDPRLRTVVCRHWLRDLCMKGAACEFLHQYDLSKMPLCRHGDRCKLKDCPFRHISEANRMECVFYKQGFCIHGLFCRYKHVRRDPQDMPAVADFSLGLSQMQAAGLKDDAKNASTRRAAPKPNEFYKISLCKHFMAGDCPFGENCHFAHGEAELRSFPRKGQNDDEHNADGTELSDKIFSNQDTTTIDYFQGGAAGGGKPIPILEPDQAHFFIVRAAQLKDLALSTVRGEWYVQRKHAELINRLLDERRKAQIMFFFTVSDSRHIQGAALVMSPARYQKAADIASNTGGEKDTPTSDPFCYRCKVEWYRTTEFPIDTALTVAPDLLLPTSSTQFCQDMSPQTGESLMKAIWNSPLVTLYESWSDDDDRGPPAPEDILTDFRAPPIQEIAWPVMPGPGFIFGCSSDTMDECLARGIFGLPAHMKVAASSIVPGATIFLFNVTDRLLFGIFEAVTPAMMDIVPTAFSKNPKATSSPFPVQVRIRVSLECPPLEDTDPILNDILRSRKGRIGPVTQAQAQAIANMLAHQCGALQYMIEYEKGLQEGARVRAPPIALPPRKVQKKDG